MKTIFSVCLVFLAVSWVNAQDNALDFDGGNQYVSVDYSTDLNASQFTLSCWAKVEGGLTTKRSVLTAQNTSGVTEGYALYVNGQNEWEFWIGTTGGAETVTWSVETLNQWVYLVGIFTGTDLILYANGIKVAEKTGLSGFSPNTVNQLSIAAGGDTGNESYFNGQLDEMSIWKVVRSEAEIRANYLKSIDRTDPNVVAFYNMVLNSDGTRLFDKTDNGSAVHHGDLQNMGNNDLITSAVYSGPQLALSFDGVDDYVDVSNGAYGLNTSEFTYEVWVYPTHEATDNTRRFIFGCDEALPNEQRPPVLAVYGENLYTGFGDDTDYYEFDAAGVITLNAWNHIAITLNEFRHYIFVNGIEILKTTLKDKQPASSPTIFLGKLGGGYFMGLMDEARIWSEYRYFGSIRSKFCTKLIDRSTQINSLERYWTMDMTGGDVLPEYIQGNHGTLVNFGGSNDWQTSAAFNTWLKTASTSWDEPLNWSRGLIPGPDDNVCTYSAKISATPLLNQDATVNLLGVDLATEFTINNSVTLNTRTALFIRETLTNNGTNRIAGVANLTNLESSIYEDNGSTEYNGSTIQKIELPHLNNLQIDNSGDSIYSSLDSLFIEGDFTVETGSFVTPFYMQVGGDMSMEMGTNLTVTDFSTLEVSGIFDSQTLNDLIINGYCILDGDLLLNSYVIGDGTISAASYLIGSYGIFGESNPINGMSYAAQNWDGMAGSNNWNDPNNWENGKIPGNGTDVSIDASTQEGNYLVINTTDAKCKSLTLNTGTKLFIESGGVLTVNKDARLETSSELGINNGAISTALTNQGFIQLTGALMPVNNLGQVTVGNYFQLLSGAGFTLDNSSFTINNNLIINASDVTLDNNATGEVGGDVNVGTGGTLNLDNNASLVIGN